MRNHTTESGATAVEYGIMVALIAAVIITVVTALGQKVNDTFETVKNAFPAPAPTETGLPF